MSVDRALAPIGVGGIFRDLYIITYRQTTKNPKTTKGDYIVAYMRLQADNLAVV